MEIKDDFADHSTAAGDINPLCDFAGLSNPAITQKYFVERAQFRALVDRAERASRGAGGIQATSSRIAWGSVLFTRIVVTAKSINHLLPNARRGEHWDFSATASITRNLLEALLVYQWLCGPGLSDDECAGRVILLYLHDEGSRRRLFQNQPMNEADAQAAEEVHADLVRRFDANAFLATFDIKQRAVALRGEKTPFIQDDVIDEMGLDRDEFRFSYRFFSQHTHTGPISFLRMLENVRGTGVETRLEKIYMISAINAALVALGHALEIHLKIFPDAETRKPHLTRQQIEANVERDQGRGKRLR